MDISLGISSSLKNKNKKIRSNFLCRLAVIMCLIYFHWVAFSSFHGTKAKAYGTIFKEFSFHLKEILFVFCNLNARNLKKTQLFRPLYRYWSLLMLNININTTNKNVTGSMQVIVIDWNWFVLFPWRLTCWIWTFWWLHSS